MNISKRLRLTGVALLLVFLASAGTYSWITVSRSCDVDAVRQASDLLREQLKRFDHAYQFATSSSPTELAHPVGTLQQIALDTRERQVPACMRSAKEELVRYMGSVIHAFESYGTGDTEAVVSALLDEADTHYRNFTVELDMVNQCAPHCLSSVSGMLHR